MLVSVAARCALLHCALCCVLAKTSALNIMHACISILHSMLSDAPKVSCGKYKIQGWGFTLEFFTTGEGGISSRGLCSSKLHPLTALWAPSKPGHAWKFDLQLSVQYSQLTWTSERHSRSQSRSRFKPLISYTSMAGELSHQTALVTGATSGIGR